MKKALVAAAALCLSLTPAFAETAETGNLMLPVTVESYQAHPVASLLLGSLSKDGESASLVGAEVSLDCPMFQAASGNVRQQLSVSSASYEHASTLLIEINPHWMNEVSENLTVGFGPGLGLAQTTVDGGDSESKFNIGLGASASYRMDQLQFGAEYRVIDASRLALKVGMAF